MFLYLQPEKKLLLKQKNRREKTTKNPLFYFHLLESGPCQIAERQTHFFTPDKKVDPCKENKARARLKKRSEINVDRIM